MKKERLNPEKPYSLQREQVRSVIAIAIISVVITGGLALLFCFDILSLMTGEMDFSNLFPYQIDWVRLIIYIAIALALSISISYLLFRATFQRKNNAVEAIPDAIESDFEQLKVTESLASNIDQTQELNDERQLNKLLLTLLKITSENTESDVTTSLQAFGKVCKSDFLGYYKLDSKSSLFSKVAVWDSEPELARHSDKLEALNLNDYSLLQTALTEGKTATFRTSMLDELLQKTDSASEDARQWMQEKVQSSFEYKLCKNEAWQYLICLPCLDQNSLAGLFVLGYFSSVLPITNTEIEKLPTLAEALWTSFNKPKVMNAQSSDESSLDYAIANLNEAIFITDTEGKIKLANPSATSLKADNKMPHTERHWTDVFHLIDADSRLPIPDPVSKIYLDLSKNIKIKNAMLLTAEGMEVEVEGIAAPIQNNRNEIIGIIFVLRDITDAVYEQNELMKAHKMDAISSLSAGLAHDFNNILTTILASISLALDDAPPGSDQAMMLKTAEDSTLKGKEITDKLLTFAKSSPPAESSSEVGNALQSITDRLVSNTNVNVTYQLNNDLPNINMPSTTFEIIISNLINNSLQAMDQSGSIIISAKTHIQNDNSSMPIKKGQYLYLTLSDTGEGISRENLSRIFVPYFTTIKGNKGLGLPTVNSLLVKHNGYINITSQPGKGTTCELYIPVAEKIVPVTPEPQAVVKPNLPIALILDEDDALSNLMVKIISNKGLKVQKTSDPHELSEMFDFITRQNQAIALVLADLNTPCDVELMPLILSFKQANPAVKLIAYGNHLQPQDLNQYQQLGFDDILTKPFNVTDLEALIKRNIS
jgi:signal transduction histidine kinase/CheY-like chemotaxis protein